MRNFILNVSTVFDVKKLRVRWTIAIYFVYCFMHDAVICLPSTIAQYTLSHFWAFQCGCNIPFYSAAIISSNIQNKHFPKPFFPFSSHSLTRSILEEIASNKWSYRGKRCGENQRNIFTHFLKKIACDFVVIAFRVSLEWERLFFILNWFRECWYVAILTHLSLTFLLEISSMCVQKFRGHNANQKNWSTIKCVGDMKIEFYSSNSTENEI